MKAVGESPTRAEMDLYIIWLPGVWLCDLALQVEKGGVVDELCWTEKIAL